MNVEGCIALVTGGNRGLGKAIIDTLLSGGAAKVYCGTRVLKDIDNPAVVPVELDVTRPDQIERAALQCQDLTLLINNAGVLEAPALTTPEAQASLRRQIEVNAVGPLSMAQAFAPIIEKNGGGAILNILSVVSWFTPPLSPAYAASKHAALALTDGLRFSLAHRNIKVSAAYPGFIDTDMTAGLDQPKSAACDIADAIIAGLERGDDHILPDERSRQVWRALRSDPHAFVANLWQAAGNPR